MKKLHAFILLLFSTFILTAQQNIISVTGRMIDLETGDPFIGVAVVEKGTRNGVVSDMDGYFSLSLPAGKHTVEISFLGFTTAELEVTKSEYWTVYFDYDSFTVSRSDRQDGRIKPDRAPVLSYQLRSNDDGPGVARLSDDMPASYGQQQVLNLRSIKPSGKGFTLKPGRNITRYKGFSIDYTSSMDVSSVGRLPATQSDYSQGYNDLWVPGGTVFSWGPSVSLWKLNGDDVDVYRPRDFFRTAVSFGNMLNVKTPAFLGGYTDIALGQNRVNSPIPNVRQDAYNFSLALRQIETGNLKTDIGAYYKTSRGDMTVQGSNIANLMYSVFTTPPTFDNRNFDHRSYSPADVDNPYTLVDKLPDRHKEKYLMAFLKTNYTNGNIEWNSGINFDKTDNKYINGTLTDFRRPIRYTERKDKISGIALNSGLQWTLRRYSPHITVGANYGFRHTSDKFTTASIFIVNDLTITPTIYIHTARLIRNSHDVNYNLKLNHGPLFVEAANRHYFSNTAKAGDYTNFFPELGASLDITELLRNWRHNLKFFGNIKRSIGEVSLIDRSPAVMSTVYASEDFSDYFEYTYPFYHDGVRPETYLKSELGLRYHYNRVGLGAEATFYANSTTNAVYPVMVPGSMEMRNVGNMRNNGYAFALSYLKHGYRWGIDLKYTFSQSRTKVTRVLGDDPYIPLAGFSDVFTAFEKGRPVGVIYGTTYKRDDAGRLIIDSDGYPVAAGELTELGNPNPDYIMTLAPMVFYRDFSLSFLVEYRHGGKRWNGTRAFMDYHGVSKGTSSARNITGYVFEGVTSSGKQNTKPVDFYDPTAPINENRWVRYGMSGVAEDYIDNASFLRLSDVTLKYTHTINRAIKNLTVGVSARNLFVISPYKGVDPDARLFDYAAAAGLDLFNAPSIRSFSFTVTLGF